jgi:outer membrane protein assembly factor BamD
MPATAARPWQLVILAALVAVAGCATGRRPVPEGATEPDKFLYERGLEELEDHKWLVSREYFREIVDNYPQSAYRADARLGIGDSYIGQGTPEAMVLAVNEFREFLTFYPTHPRADYAQYKIGVTYYEQMRAAQRDQSETRQAIAEFELLLDQYPNSTLTSEALVKLREAKDRLGESDYRVGLFYYRAKWYPGAIDRFTALLDRDPEYTGRDAVYYYLGESLLEAERPAEALPYFERLVSEFEQSEYLEDTTRRIAELKSDHDTDPH